MIKTILVGSHFVPPAEAVLTSLRQGCPVWLEAEPDNPYDSNAIMVFVSVEEIDLEEIDEGLLESMGSSREELEERDEICLGHVAASSGKPLLKASVSIPGLVGTREIAAEEGGDLQMLDARLRFVGELIVIELKGH